MISNEGTKAKDLWLQFLSATPPTNLTRGKFPMLIAIASKIISSSVSTHLGRSHAGEDVIAMCMALAGDLSSFIIELRCWVSEKSFMVLLLRFTILQSNG